MKVGYIQFAPVLGDVRANISKIDSLIGPSVAADILVLPELCNSGYNFRSYDDARACSESVNESVFVEYLESIAAKKEAVKEVIYYIHKAGLDIENARKMGPAAMEPIVKMVRAHVPAHTRDAIIQSLRPDLNVINYRHPNVDGRLGLQVWTRKHRHCSRYRLQHGVWQYLSLQSVPSSLDQLALRERPRRGHGDPQALGSAWLGGQVALGGWG